MNFNSCPLVSFVLVTARQIFRVLCLSAIVCGITIGQEKATTNPLEEVVVTGSRIQRSGMTTPVPVTAVTSDELSRMSPGNIIEAMTQLPQFYGSTTPTNTAGFFTSPGAGSLNLRGLATKRTLTLLDGRRVVPSTIYGGPDINLFPKEMIKRVESVTGGASAQYGTDAVSGVVNFILDTDFKGLRGHVQGGETGRGDNANWEASIAGGMDFAQRGHVLLSMEHYQQDPVYQYPSWFDAWGVVGGGAGQPARLVLPKVYSNVASYDGVFSLAGTKYIFNSDGSYSPFVNGSVTSNALGGSHSVVNGGSGTDNSSDRPNFQQESARDNVFAYVDYDVSDNLNVYGQGIYGSSMFQGTNAGGFFAVGGGGPVSIYSGNPFLPASLQAAMTASSTASIALNRIGYSTDLASGAFVEQDTKVYSGTVGFKYNVTSAGLFNGWNLGGYYQYGKNEAQAIQKGGIRLDRIYLALDAVTDPVSGATRCRVTVVSGLYPDCVPLNLMGRGQASQAALDWVTGFDPGIPVTVTPYLPGYPSETYSYTSTENKLRDIDLELNVVEFNASGEIWKGFGAGPVSMAFGGHYREESLDQKVQAAQGNVAADPSFYPVPCNDGTTINPNVTYADCPPDPLNPLISATRGIRGVPAANANNSVEFQFSKVPFARGGFNVKEIYSEIFIPVLKDWNFIKEANITGSGRWANYSGSGDIWAYKAGAEVTIMNDLRLRGTYSRDVRAASLGERYDRTGALGNVTDYGLSATTPPSYEVFLVSGGNPTVQPEEADTFTAGFVYRPHWLDGFDLSIDWYDVDLSGSIEQFTAQQIVDACYRFGDTDQCANIERTAPPRPGFAQNSINIVNATFQNISQAKVSGVDFEADYRTELNLLGGGEQLYARFLASYLDQNSTTSSNGVKIDRAGETGFFSLPEWKFTGNVTYTRGPVSAFLQGRFISSGVQNATWVEGVDIDNNSVDSAFYLDGRLSYTLRYGGGSWEVYATGTNLLDQDPPVALGAFGYTGFGATSGGGYNSALFDILGRRFVVGLKFDF